MRMFSWKNFNAAAMVQRTTSIWIICSSTLPEEVNIPIKSFYHRSIKKNFMSENNNRGIKYRGSIRPNYPSNFV